MDLSEKKVKEMQISEDISEALALYDLQELDSENEISEGIEQIHDLGRRYRHIHIELKAVMIEGHDEAYIEYPRICETIRNFVKNAKAKIKLLKNEEKEKEEHRLESERKGEEEKAQKMRDEVESNERKSVMIEEQVFREKLEMEIKHFELNESDEIKNTCSKFSTSLDEYYKLLSKVKIIFGADYEKECKEIFDSTIDLINDQIKIGKIKIKELSARDEENITKMRTEKDKLVRDSFIKEQKFHADILFNEIEMRCTSLMRKCDSSELDNMSDHQILERHKNMNIIDCEMREIFGRVTAFSKIAVLCGDERDEMLIIPRTHQDAALKSRNAFAMKLYAIFTERDISEEKLKNVSTLNIELAKFKGYDSKLDIYSFKTQFEKMVQPTILKRYWLDTLKNKYLAGPAFILVERTETIEEIWSKLISAYGNVKLLLQNKISNLDKIDNLERVKGDEKIAIALAKIINMMTELQTLAKKHGLETKLYVGGGLEKVLSLIGEERERKFLSKIFNKNSEKPSADETSSGVLEEKLEWENLTKFLKSELSLREKLTLMQKSKNCLGITSGMKSIPKDIKKDKNAFFGGTPNNKLKCHICEKTDHVLSSDRNGKKYVDYFSCKAFVDMSPKERRTELQKKKLCLQCLIPGMKYDEKHTCYDKYVCSDSYHKKFPKGLHILICEAHKNKQSNIDLLEEYKNNVISKRSGNFENFTKNISLVCQSDSELTPSTFEEANDKVLPDVFENAIFMLQTINVGEKKLNLFYDTGCGDVVIKKSAIDVLMSMGRAKLVAPGPIVLSGVGDHKSVCEHGIYSICLPLKNGFDAVLSGICLDRVTSNFPMYDLKDVEKDVRRQCRKQDGAPRVKALPKLSREIGGETDILLGIKYLKYHPQKVWESPTGLSLSESCFLSADGTTGVIGGPHAAFTKVDRKQKSAQTGKAEPLPVYTCFSSSVHLYRSAYCSLRDMPLLGEKYDVITDFDRINEFTHIGQLELEPSVSQVEHSIGNEDKLEPYTCNMTRKTPKCVKKFDEVESACTEVTYRCVRCRSCQECKRSSKIDAVSIQEEIEQDLINQCVKVDLEKGITIAKLPFITDPDTKLVPNEKMARKIYESQIRALANKPDDKEAVIKSEGKLQELSFVDYLDNLSDSDKNAILNSVVRYVIPWRAVWNENSLSTPCRLVLDASCCPKGGCSLNSLLAKGTNNMNKLVVILIRWTIHKYAFHTDITKMYNAIVLDKAHWRYQLYLWDEKLRVGVAPRWKVIKTAIYGVRPSGNIAECGIRKTAELTRSECPKAYDVINKDIYVDDCLSGDNSADETLEKTDQLTNALRKGGFILKGFTFSGRDPPEHLSRDGTSVVVGGLRWFSEKDLISLNISELNFAKKNRGRKSPNVKGKIPVTFTKRDCVSRTAEIFDPTGRVTPLTSGLKIDINELTLRKLSWDDEVPESLRQIWSSNFEMIEEIGKIKFKRAVIPEDAVDLNVETIDTGDASQKMICVAIYARFRRKSGGYSCQLVFARSKIVPQDLSLPRAELLAASINATTGHVVKTAFGDKHKKCLKLTDSQVALHWIGCTRSKLKMWVRNKVIEINRLVDVNDWRYVNSKNMIADVGTRKGMKVEDVGPDSEWINGLEWMRGEQSDFPVKSAAELVLSSESKREAIKESIVIDFGDKRSDFDFVPDLVHLSIRYVPNALSERYIFSRYLIDPNRFRFRKVARVLGLVILFVNNLLEKMKKPHVKLMQYDLNNSPEIMSYPGDKYIVTTGTGCRAGLVVDLPRAVINAAMYYYFLKATDEVKHFLPESKYENISVERNRVLYYTGRILETQKISGQLTLCDTSFDLLDTTYCVPVVDNLSPIAYAISNEIHWYHPDVKHGGIESLLRRVQCIVHVIGGRKLIKTMKIACIQCRLLQKKQVEVTMGPKHDSNLCIAPAFHNTQVDICGPFDSYSNSNKRAKVKIWFVVFCCCTTGAVDCKVMEDYSTDSFILAFIRFSCRYGYPCNLFPDYGSQLVKGCKDMVLTFADIKHKLSVEFGVQFKTCPVGAHYVHGKVERKIGQIKKSFEKELHNHRLSVIQWETLGQQVVNSINNLPIGLGNKTECLENLDLITPNRLLLGRNNDRCPTVPLVLSRDVKKVIATNSDIHKTWFKSWLISYVPTLVEKPKWFENDKCISKGDIVLFLKSEKEFENQYQYGIVRAVYISKDGHIRSADIEYKNHNEDAKRTTKRGVRDLVVIHPVDEIGISKELHELSNGQV